ncbi:MAG: hypothetical protein ACYDBQ_11955, partial [Thermoplasmatota archaeon]
PKPPVSKVVAAAGKQPAQFRVNLLQSEEDTMGTSVGLDFVLDRTVEPTKAIYLKSIRKGPEAPGANGTPNVPATNERPRTGAPSFAAPVGRPPADGASGRPPADGGSARSPVDGASGRSPAEGASGRSRAQAGVEAPAKADRAASWPPGQESAKRESQGGETAPSMFGRPVGGSADATPPRARPSYVAGPDTQNPAPVSGQGQAKVALNRAPSRGGSSSEVTLDVARALSELASMSLDDIEHQTALTWGARAVACFQRCGDATDWETGLSLYGDGENYRGESLEHAAMTSDWQTLIPALETQISAARSQAERALRKAVPANGSAGKGGGDSEAEGAP